MGAIAKGERAGRIGVLARSFHNVEGDLPKPPIRRLDFDRRIDKAAFMGRALSQERKNFTVPVGQRRSSAPRLAGGEASSSRRSSATGTLGDAAPLARTHRDP